jgi:hypothetical protein
MCARFGNRAMRQRPRPPERPLAIKRYERSVIGWIPNTPPGVERAITLVL